MPSLLRVREEMGDWPTPRHRRRSRSGVARTRRPVRIRRLPRIAGLVFVVVAILASLGVSAPGARAASPSLAILAPTNGAVIGNGTPVTVVFVVSDFNLTAPGASGATPDAGYVDVYVNGNLTASVDQETVVLPLPSGVYHILLRLMLANGTSPVPEVTASVTATVTQGPAVGVPRINITYVEITFPTPGVVLNDDVTISFQVTDFALVPPTGDSTIPNEGHVKVFVDGIYYQAVTSYGPVFFSDLTDGGHTITVQLVDDLGHPLTPDASSSIAIRIQSSPIVDVTPYLLDAQIVLAIAIVVVLFYRGTGLTRIAALRKRSGGNGK